MHPLLRQFTSLALIGALLFCGGCTTEALWSRNGLDRFREPASEARLQLSLAPQAEDVLVQYDEVREDDSRTRRRAYFLYANQDRVKRSHKPDFNDPRRTNGLVPILLVPGPLPALPTPMPDLFADASTNGHGFTLYRKDHSAVAYELPVYPDASGTIKRVLLTPLTVAADVSIIGGILGLIWWSGIAHSHYEVDHAYP